MREVDAMLADHDHDHPDPLVAAGVASDGRPRTTWPTTSAAWTDADRAARRYWVNELYGNQRLSMSAVGEMLHLDRKTVRSVAEDLGIYEEARRSRTAKAVKMDARRAEVKRVFDERQGRVTGAEIAEILGLPAATVVYDMQFLGLVPAGVKNARPRLNDVVGRAVSQMKDLGEYLLNNPDLHHLNVNDEQAAAMRKQLTTIVKGVSRVRKYLNDNQGENR